MKRIKVAIFVLVLAFGCEASASGCRGFMEPEVQDGPAQEQAPGR